MELGYEWPGIQDWLLLLLLPSDSTNFIGQSYHIHLTSVLKQVTVLIKVSWHSRYSWPVLLYQQDFDRTLSRQHAWYHSHDSPDNPSIVTAAQARSLLSPPPLPWDLWNCSHLMYSFYSICIILYVIWTGPSRQLNNFNKLVSLWASSVTKCAVLCVWIHLAVFRTYMRASVLLSSYHFPYACEASLLCFSPSYTLFVTRLSVKHELWICIGPQCVY